MRSRFLIKVFLPELAGFAYSTAAWAALDFLRELYPQFPNIDEVTEAFVLRDIMAHNHLWEIGIFGQRS